MTDNSCKIMPHNITTQTIVQQFANDQNKSRSYTDS